MLYFHGRQLGAFGAASFSPAQRQQIIQIIKTNLKPAAAAYDTTIINNALYNLQTNSFDMVINKMFAEIDKYNAQFTSEPVKAGTPAIPKIVASPKEPSMMIPAVSAVTTTSPAITTMPSITMPFIIPATQAPRTKESEASLVAQGWKKNADGSWLGPDKAGYSAAYMYTRFGIEPPTTVITQTSAPTGTKAPAVQPTTTGTWPLPGYKVPVNQDTDGRWYQQKQDGSKVFLTVKTDEQGRTYVTDIYEGIKVFVTVQPAKTVGVPISTTPTTTIVKVPTTPTTTTVPGTGTTTPPAVVSAFDGIKNTIQLAINYVKAKPIVIGAVGAGIFALSQFGKKKPVRRRR